MQSNKFIEATPGPFAASIASLKLRENSVDVGISDYLETHVASKACFFTPNHPRNFVLAELAKRLCDRADIGLEPRATAVVGELDKIQIRPHPTIAAYYQLAFGSEPYLGLDVLGVDGRTVQLGGAQAYDMSKLVETYFRIYDRALKN
jgi:hypothetical protein